MAIVLLLRHGHSTANAQGVLAGWTEGVGLTDTGREQAARVAERLAPLTIARAVSSPLQRCLETASVALAGHDVGRDDRLGECHYGGWTGRSLADAAKEPLWRVVQDDPGAATFPPDDVYAAESLDPDGASGWSAGCGRSTPRSRPSTARTRCGWRSATATRSRRSSRRRWAPACPACSGCGSTPGSLTAVHLTENRMVLLASNTVQGDLAPLVTRPAHAPAGDSEVGGGAG